MEKVNNPANQVVLLRVLLAFASIILLYYGDASLKLAGALLIPVTMFLDYVDGWIARKFNCATRLGSFLDVLGDRITETVYWIFFLGIGLVPLWAPLIIITRGLVTDSIRGIAVREGKTVYGSASESSLGRVIVSSRVMRGLANVKFLVFILLGFQVAGYAFYPELVLPLIALSVLVNLVRGLPVISSFKGV